MWVNLKVQFAISLFRCLFVAPPGAEYSVTPSGPSKLELISRDVTGESLSNSHLRKSN